MKKDNAQSGGTCCMGCEVLFEIVDPSCISSVNCSVTFKQKLPAVYFEITLEAAKSIGDDKF